MKGKLKEWLKTKGKGTLGTALELVGDVANIEVLEKIGEKLQDSPDLTPEEKAEARQIILEEIKLANADRDSARKMQIAALEQNDKFSKRFVYFMAAFWSLIGAVYLFMVTFTKVAHNEHANTIIGFLLGTIVATIINFFFGSSEGSKKKTDILGK